MKKSNEIDPIILKRLESYRKKDWVRMLKEMKLQEIARKMGVSMYIISQYLDRYICLPEAKPKESSVTNHWLFEDYPIALTEGAWMNSKERRSYLQYRNNAKEITYEQFININN